MKQPNEMAFEAAATITAAYAQASGLSPIQENVEDIADFFEELYKKLLTIASSES